MALSFDRAGSRDFYSFIDYNTFKISCKLFSYSFFIFRFPKAKVKPRFKTQKKLNIIQNDFNNTLFLLFRCIIFKRNNKKVSDHLKTIGRKQNRGLMTEGVIWKELLLFSIPLLLGNLFQQLYNAVDSMVVGQNLGAQALAAVGSSGPVINLLISFFQGISVGAGVIISRYFGARNNNAMSDAIHTSLSFTFFAGIALTFIGIAFSPLILTWIGTPADVMDNSILYLRIYFAGILSVMLYNMCSGILRAVGDSKNPLYFLILSSLTNVVLDIVFIVYLHMGIDGAAWATLLSQTLSAILTLMLLCKSKQEYRVEIRKIHCKKDVLFEIIRLGLPSGIQNAIVSFSNVIVQSNINAFGSLAMAGCGAYTKIDGFAILPVMSFSMAFTTFISQNMGAQKLERVKKGAETGIFMSVTTTICISMLLFLFGPQLLSIFSNDTKVIEYGLYMLHVLVPGYIFLALSHALAGIVRGAGITTVPMIVMVCCWCGLRMVWILGSVPIFHDIGVVFLGWPITWIASAIWLYIYYKKGNWIYSYS